ncbi:MAG: thiamine ABC transporter substrate-binding protein [Acidimicrobiales bacterium]|nr:thiamine ABC transporter substrate-binding protein [Acidimicrobiales bacterium]
MRKYLSIPAITVLFAIFACGSSQPSTDRINESSVTLITHDSFAVSDGLFETFTSKTGITVEQLSLGDTGQLLSTSILTKSNPIGDVIFGIDNTFLGRALDAEIFVPYKSPLQSQIIKELDHEKSDYLTPVDYGHVCLNYWKSSFSDNFPPPKSIDDLLNPLYAKLLVVQNPETSSPGLAFLLATISHFGNNWENFWKTLEQNGVSVTSDWESSYYGDFIAGGGEKSIVVSYASSPIAELIYSNPPSQTPPTGIIEDSCFKQIEYAGILKNSQNIPEAEALLDFLLSQDFQEDIPLNMFMMPVLEKAVLPAAFSTYPTIPSHLNSITSAEIDANRNNWTEIWTETVLR